MAKHYTKEQKIEMLNRVKHLGCANAAKILNMNKSNILRTCLKSFRK